MTRHAESIGLQSCSYIYKPSVYGCEPQAAAEALQIILPCYVRRVRNRRRYILPTACSPQSHTVL